MTLRPHGVRRLLPAAGVVLGVLLIAVALIPWSAYGRAPKNLDTPTTFTAGSIPTPASTSIQSVAPANRAGSSPIVLQTKGSAPIRLGLASAHVQARILPVVTTGGALGVPPDPSDVGWWTGSARPGSRAGSVVLDGHVDSAVLGVGVLSHLATLHANDLVTVQTADGVTHSYRVYSRQSFVKHEGLPASLFATTGAPRLVLITCGGTFDQSSRSYENNVVVFALPA